MPAIFDPDVEPDPLDCPHCSHAYRWEWWTPDASRWPSLDASATRARWAAPKIPCPGCTSTHEADEKRTNHRTRQRHAGVTGKDVPWRLDRVLFQDPDEDEIEFRARVRRKPRHLGVFADDMAAFDELAEWRPGKRSIYISGPTGCGKTALACALASKLLDIGEEGATSIPFDTLRKAYGADRAAAIVREGNDRAITRERHFSALVISHAELIERMRLAWDRDRAPLAQVHDEPGLIFDDLGDVMKKGSKSTLPAESFQRLIRERYRDERGMVITSNIPMFPVYHCGHSPHDYRCPDRCPECGEGSVKTPGARSYFGDRAFSRLFEMTLGSVHTLTPCDWRNDAPTA